MEYILNKQKSHQIKNNTTTRFNYNSFLKELEGSTLLQEGFIIKRALLRYNLYLIGGKSQINLSP